MIHSYRKLVLQDSILPDAFCSAYFELDRKKAEDFHSRRSVRNPQSDRIGSSLRLCCFGDIKAVVTSIDGPPLVVASQSIKKVTVRDQNSINMDKISFFIYLSERKR